MISEYGCLVFVPHSSFVVHTLHRNYQITDAPSHSWIRIEFQSPKQGYPCLKARRSVSLNTQIPGYACLRLHVRPRIDMQYCQPRYRQKYIRSKHDHEFFLSEKVGFFSCPSDGTDTGSEADDNIRSSTVKSACKS